MFYRAVHVNVGVLTPRNLSSRETGRELLSLLTETLPACAPEKYGASEPREPIDLAYAALVTAEDMTDLAKYQEGPGQFAEGIYSHQIRHGLPWLPWLTFFGRPYVEMWGAERLRSVPAHHVEERAPSLFEMQLTPAWGDCVSRHREVEDARERVLAHLGPEAFCGRADLGRAPDFGWEALEVNRRRGIARV